MSVEESYLRKRRTPQRLECLHPIVAGAGKTLPFRGGGGVQTQMLTPTPPPKLFGPLAVGGGGGGAGGGVPSTPTK